VAEPLDTAGATDTHSAGLPGWSRRDAAWLALALVATALVFARSLAGGLVYDDLLLVARNPEIRSLSNLARHFTRPYWDFLDPGATEQTGYWRPLSAVAHTLAYVAGGGSLVAFHVLCVLLHLGATAAAFVVARRLGASASLAGLAALLFGLHPTHVESVAWISALNDPLFGLFALLSLAAYLGWRARGSRGAPLLSAVFFALSLLSKEMAMAVPPLLLALDLGRPRAPGEPAGRLGGLHGWQRVLLSFGVVLALYYLARVLVFDEIAAGLRPTIHFGVSATRLVLLRLELVGGALRLLAWPVALNAFRPFRPDLRAADPELFLAGLTTALALALLAWLFLRQRVPELAAGLTILAGFSPALVSVGSLGLFPLSDRFLYVPVLGFTLLLALLARRVLAERAAHTLLLVVAALYGWRSFDRIGVWRDETTFFATAARESPRSPYVLWGYGRTLLDDYQRTRDPAVLSEFKSVVDRATALLEEAKQPGSDLFVTSEDYLQVNLETGWYYVFEAQADEYGSYATPIAIFEELARRVGELEDKKRDARALGVRSVSGSLELDLVYTALGSVYRLAGRLDDAEAALKKALMLDPREPKALRELGRLYARKGDWKLAIRELDAALALEPGDPESALALAQACFEAQELERAEPLAQALVDRPETSADACLVLASIRLERRSAQEALVWIERALQARPDLGHAWYLKARALLLAGVNEEATLAAFRRATELEPDAFEPNYDFGAYLLQKNAPGAAIPFLVRAYAHAADPRLAAGLYRTLSAPDLPYDSALPLFELARVEVRRGRWDVAEPWLDRALALDPEHGPSLFQKGRVLRHLKRDAEAVELMRRGCERLPDDFVAQSEFGLYLGDLGRADEARPYLTRALTLPPPADWHPDAAKDLRAKIQQALGTAESP
jgi:tetratricopeptide (TPR) repeat protein